MRIFWLVSAAALMLFPAHAETARGTLAEIAKCADIAAAAERLQCYDSAAIKAKSLLSAAPSGPQQAEDEGGGVLDWFGLGGSKPVKKVEDFGRPPEPVAGPKEITEISARVVKFSRTAKGKGIFTLDNGQVWTQIQGDTTEVFDPRSGAEVTIEKALLGSYALIFRDRKGLIKVRRTK